VDYLEAGDNRADALVQQLSALKRDRPAGARKDHPDHAAAPGRASRCEINRPGSEVSMIEIGDLIEQQEKRQQDGRRRLR